MRQETRQEMRRAEQPRQTPMTPYAQSHSILYPDRSGESYSWYNERFGTSSSAPARSSKTVEPAPYGSYTSNGIFDKDSYFNNPNRRAISREQYSKNFGGSDSKLSEGHQLSSQRTPAPQEPAKPAAQPAQEEKPASSYSEMYAQAEENRTVATGLGKFRDVDALLEAYTSLEAEFTRRSQRLKELERAVKEAAPAQAAASDTPSPQAGQSGAQLSDAAKNDEEIIQNLNTLVDIDAQKYSKKFKNIQNNKQREYIMTIIIGNLMEEIKRDLPQVDHDQKDKSSVYKKIISYNGLVSAISKIGQAG